MTSTSTVADPFDVKVDRLCRSSRRAFESPYDTFDWPDEVDADAWYTSPELVTIHGAGVWDDLDGSERRRLAFFEAVNFYSLNIHGERSLMQGLAARLYRRDTGPISPYLHHFLAEENNHSIWFGRFCTTYAGKVYPERKVTFAETERLPGEEDFLFFAKVLIFEEIADGFNQLMARDERLAPLARRINLHHHRDESRHLVFGRAMTARLFATHAPSWPAGRLEAIRRYLAAYLAATWREYYNPSAYRDAGLADPWRLAEQAWDRPGGRLLRRRMSDKCIQHLLAVGILEKEPEL